MNVLIYSRPNSKAFLLRLAKEIDPLCNTIVLSDFKGSGDIWCGNFIYSKREIEYFDKDTIDNIILRCRFLRSISKGQAFKLINRYTYGILAVFKKYKPDIVLGQLPDNYCMDIIQRIAVDNNVTIINMIGEFISGYCRMTLRGERINTRNASFDEARMVLKELLDKDYKSNYSNALGHTFKKHLYYFYRRKLIESIYYPMKKHLKNDPMNYHYNTFIFKGLRRKDVVNKDIEKLFTHIDQIVDFSKCIYIPLHCYPEATVDYYGENPAFALYEELMLRLVKESDKCVTLLIKEHPAMYGARAISFYKRLKSYGNVVLLNPYDNSNYVLSKVKYVLVFSGSVGIEAVIRNKVVYNITDNYYSDLSPNIHKIERIDNKLLNLDYIPYDNVRFMQQLLCGLMNVKMGNQSNLLSSDIAGMGKYMKEYYENHPKQILN